MWNNSWNPFELILKSILAILYCLIQIICWPHDHILIFLLTMPSVIVCWYCFFAVIFLVSLNTTGMLNCLDFEDLYNLSLIDSLQKNTTVDGHKCQFWNSSPDHTSLSENYCHFDPTDEHKLVGPWCYTSGSSWSYCYVECSHAELRCLPNNEFHPNNRHSSMYQLSFVANRWPNPSYRGAKNSTITGRPCLPWVKAAHINAEYYGRRFPGSLCFDDGFIYLADDKFFNDMGPWCITELMGIDEFSYEHCYPLCDTDINATCLDENIVDMMQRQFNRLTVTDQFARGMWGRIYIYKNVTAAGLPCLSWSHARKVMGVQQQSRDYFLFSFQDNFCRTVFEAAVPSCFIQTKSGGIKLQPCHFRCALETRSEFEHQIILDDRICYQPQDRMIKMNRNISNNNSSQTSQIITVTRLVSSNLSFNSLDADNKCKFHLGFQDDHYRCIRKDSVTRKLIAEKCQQIFSPPAELTCRKRGDRLAHYKGTKRTSATGVKCVKWVDVKSLAARDGITAETFGHPLDDEYDFCRNPISDPCGPFCYTDYSEGRRLPCFPVCKPEIHSGFNVPCLSRSFLLSTTFDWRKVIRTTISVNQQECATVLYGETFNFTTTAVQESDRSCRRVHLTKGLQEKVPVCRVDSGSSPRVEPCLVACEDLRRTCIPKTHLMTYPYMGMKNVSVDGLPCVPWNQVKRAAKATNKDGPLSSFLQLNSTKTHNLMAQIQRDLIKFLLPFAHHNFCLNVYDRIHSTDEISSRYTGTNFQLLPSQLKGPWCFVQETSIKNSWTPKPCFQSCEDLGAKNDETEVLYPCHCGFSDCFNFDEDIMASTDTLASKQMQTTPFIISDSPAEIIMEASQITLYSVALIVILGSLTVLVLLISFGC